ncbi:arylsulfatase [Rhodocytophaga rosea]|uniref:Arylsulfatase n=1 Tax=Rhodocytophaga rosea TaxID=2704465 RepID=A0A6C0GNL5_9BACT|nr:arylsulfatase [Rhodocytophaga rosea]QHT69626.1 arylsulfatase [Rhodocytophaga rosea]
MKITCSLLILLIIIFTSCQPSKKPDQTTESIETKNKPVNIIFIMADDLGYGDLGVYGQKLVKTPRLDQMAQEGIRFTQYYAGSTVCAPSRCSLMTGKHMGNSYVRGNGGPNTPGRPGDCIPLRPQDSTFVQQLKKAGYVNGMFGKWGLGVAGTNGAPHLKGFDAFLGDLNQKDAHSYTDDTLWTIRNGVTQPVVVDTSQFKTDLTIKAALDFIRQNKDTNFFVYLPVNIPHAELKAPKEAVLPYLDANGKSIFEEVPFINKGSSYRSQAMPRATFAGMVSRMDLYVGQVLDLLRELKLDENTIVFFTSDNGAHKEGGHDPNYFNSSGGLRGIKRDLYEGGVRVPMIVWAPGRVAAGKVSDHIWAHWDIYPTLTQLAGVKINTQMDGISMAPVITGKGEAPSHEYLYWEFGEGVPVQAIRQGNWKLVRFLEKGKPARVELYDLNTDMQETKDLSGQKADVTAQLIKLLDEAHQRAEFPEFRFVENAM